MAYSLYFSSILSIISNISFSLFNLILRTVFLAIKFEHAAKTYKMSDKTQIPVPKENNFNQPLEIAAKANAELATSATDARVFNVE